MFAIHGAKMTPDRPHPNGWPRSLPRERRAKPAGQWNTYRITARDGKITLAVNGAEVSGGYDITPRKGYIALESEGSPALFRNLRIAELPSSGTLAPEHVASTDDGFRSLYNGQDLTGWRATSGGWTPKDWTLVYSAAAAGAGGSSLVSADDYADFSLIVDWKMPKDSGRARTRSRRAAQKVKEPIRLAVSPGRRSTRTRCRPGGRVEPFDLHAARRQADGHAEWGNRAGGGGARRSSARPHRAAADGGSTANFANRCFVKRY